LEALKQLECVQTGLINVVHRNQHLVLHNRVDDYHSAYLEDLLYEDRLVSEMLNGAQSQGAETSKIYLNDLSIKPSQSCGVDPHPKFCLFDDDVQTFYDALDSCDAIVLGSPVYFDTVNAQTKLMIDRCNCLMVYLKGLMELMALRKG